MASTRQGGHQLAGAATNFGIEILGNNFSVGGDNTINIRTAIPPLVEETSY
jgi:hypothetical protein